MNNNTSSYNIFNLKMPWLTEIITSSWAAFLILAFACKLAFLRLNRKLITNTNNNCYKKKIYNSKQKE